MRIETLSPRALIDAVIKFSKPIAENFGYNIKAETKSDRTPVTRIDQEVNTLFLDWTKTFSNLGFIGEEGNGDLDNKYILYVDPLDGTEMFMQGVATCTTIVTNMRMDDVGKGTPHFTIIHNPNTGEVWYALENNGAHKFNVKSKDETLLKTAPIHSEELRNPVRTSICTWPGSSHNLEEINNLINDDGQFKNLPINALGIGGALIAQNTLDVVVCGETSAVEMAAMSLLVREAGGITIDMDGKEITKFTLGEWKGKKDFLLPNGAIIAANESVAKKTLRFIQNNQ